MKKFNIKQTNKKIEKCLKNVPELHKQNNINNFIAGDNNNYNFNNFYNEEEEDLPVPRPNELFNVIESNFIPNLIKCDKCGKEIEKSKKGEHLLIHQPKKELQKEFLNNKNINKNENNIFTIKMELNRVNFLNNNNLKLIRNEFNNNIFEENLNQEMNRGINSQNVNLLHVNRVEEENEIKRNENPDEENEEINECFFNVSPFTQINNVFENELDEPIPFNFEVNNIEMMLEPILFPKSPVDTKIVANLPENILKDISKLSTEKKKCLICLEEFIIGDKTIFLPCIHIFHAECIKKWLKNQNSCPICKLKISNENIYKNYK